MHKAVTDAMRWVGSRITRADVVDVEHAVVASSGDLAYTVGFERTHFSVDGGHYRQRPAAAQNTRTIWVVLKTARGGGGQRSRKVPSSRQARRAAV
jgi:hypothetical protein